MPDVQNAIGILGEVVRLVIYPYQYNYIMWPHVAANNVQYYKKDDIDT